MGVTIVHTDPAGLHTGGRLHDVPGFQDVPEHAPESAAGETKSGASPTRYACYASQYRPDASNGAGYYYHDLVLDFPAPIVAAAPNRAPSFASAVGGLHERGRLGDR